MNLSRRNFLRAGTVSALLAGLNLSPTGLVFGQTKSRVEGGFAIPYEAKTDSMFYFTRETFAPYLNSTFQLTTRTKGVVFAATLVGIFDYQAQARARKSKTHGGECFSLTFRAGERETVSQGAYKFSHAALGRFSLFVVPGKADDGSTTYEAVINHLA
jgi:hypothetical protein